MKIYFWKFLFLFELTQANASEEENAELFMDEFEPQCFHHINTVLEAAWSCQVNITDVNLNKLTNLTVASGEFWKNISQKLETFNWKEFKSEDLRRRFKLLTKQGTNLLLEKDQVNYTNAISQMERNFAEVQICEYENRTNCKLSLEPEIEEILRTTRDPEKLKYYWQEFYDKAGTPSRKPFESYIELSNKAAVLNNFTSMAEEWIDAYETEDIVQQSETIVSYLRPFYLQIHGYVRHRLRKHYGSKVVSETGPIPMHLLGDMYGTVWSNINDIVAPFPEKKFRDVSQEMVRQGYTPLKMIQMADEYFISMNLSRLPETFWNKSNFEKPSDGHHVECHPTAWDMYAYDDVRISMCSRVTQQQLFNIYDQLGHIQYFLNYQNMSCVFHGAPNPGFHEAVGNVVSLAVSTPKHLTKIGLLKDYVPDQEDRINHLFSTALNKIVILPFALSLDKYRWALFRGEIKKEDWNCVFWKLREEYSGIEPPVIRTEKNFDPTAKYHVSADMEYLRYLVADILQFQFYKAVCLKAGQYNPNDPNLPLDNCDIYGSIEAGNAFKAMLSLGSSKPWPDALEAITGERNMSATAIIEYFEPLRIWLEKENKKNNVTLGWFSSDKCIKEEPFKVKVELI